MAEMVQVGCRLPHGLVMELIKPGPMRRPSPRGTRVTLKGANSVLTGRDNFNPIVSSFGVTAVEKDFAEAWFKANEDADFIKSGAVFRVKTENDAKAAMREREKDTTGLEPLNPGTDAKGESLDPRMPQGVTSDEEHLKSLGIKL